MTAKIGLFYQKSQQDETPTVYAGSVPFPIDFNMNFYAAIIDIDIDNMYSLIATVVDSSENVIQRLETIHTFTDNLVRTSEKLFSGAINISIPITFTKDEDYEITLVILDKNNQPLDQQHTYFQVRGIK